MCAYTQACSCVYICVCVGNDIHSHTCIWHACLYDADGSPSSRLQAFFPPLISPGFSDSHLPVLPLDLTIGVSGKAVGQLPRLLLTLGQP